MFALLKLTTAFVFQQKMFTSIQQPKTFRLSEQVFTCFKSDEKVSLCLIIFDSLETTRVRNTLFTKHFLVTLQCEHINNEFQSQGFLADGGVGD